MVNPPFAMRRDGELTGFEIDLMRAVGERISHEPTFVEQSSPGLYPSLLARRVDVVASGLRATTEASSEICFTGAVLPGSLGVVVHDRHSPTLDGLEALDGARVVAAAETLAASWMVSALGGVGAQVAVTPTVDDAFAELGAGLARAVVVDLPIALYRRAHEDDKLRVLERIDHDPPFAWGMHPDNGALADAIDEALGDLREDGTYGEIYRRWFGEDPPT